MNPACSIYGLGVQVNVPIAGLRGLGEPARVDVVMTLGSMPAELNHSAAADQQPYYDSVYRDEKNRPLMRMFRILGGRYFRCDYTDGTRIALDANGTAVWATWPEPATIEDTATYLLGPTLGLVLRLRGTTCLHASAVNVGGKAIAFVGPSGSGKSSLAAAFVQRGLRVLSDDVAPLTRRGPLVMVQPAYPRVRLWPSSVAGLFGSAEALPRLTPGWDKRFLDMSGPGGLFQADPLPLGAIYLLGERSSTSAPRIEPVHLRDGLLRLIANTYANHLLTPSLRSKEFDFLSGLTKTIPIRLVCPSEGFDDMSALCGLIEQDVARMSLGEPAYHASGALAA